MAMGVPNNDDVLSQIGYSKVVFGRQFPQKNVAERLFRHILQDTIFLQNGEMYNFVCRLILSQNFLCVTDGLPEIIPFPVQLPLKLLERNLYNKILLTLKYA